MDATDWALFIALGLLTFSVLLLTHSHRQLQKRVDALELTAPRAEETRRAHLRLDTQQRQLEALAKELGWSDDRAHLRVLTERLPASR